jgi:DNA-binding CsgD family transcriptional regulator
MGNVASTVMWNSALYTHTTQRRREPAWTYYSQVSVASPSVREDDQEPDVVFVVQGSLALAEPDPDATEERQDATTAPRAVVEDRSKDAENQWGPWSLTQRELEVLQLLAEGATNNEISGRLFISPKTTKNHLAAIFQKLDVTNRTHALVRDVIMGLVSIE